MPTIPLFNSAQIERAAELALAHGLPPQGEVGFRAALLAAMQEVPDTTPVATPATLEVTYTRSAGLAGIFETQVPDAQIAGQMHTVRATTLADLRRRVELHPAFAGRQFTMREV